MQAAAAKQIAPGKAYRSNGGNVRKDEPSNPKKANVFFSSNGCNEARSAFLDDGWDSLAPHQRAEDTEVSSTDTVDFLEPSCPGSLDASRECTHSQSSEFEDSADCAFLNETYSIHFSESERKNESLIHLTSELDSEMQNTEGVCFDILEHQGIKIIGLERTCRISDDDYKETAEDEQKHEINEDSQQEYHSAEEQEHISAPVSFDQTKTLNTPDLEVVGLRNSGYEAECASHLDGNRVELASDSSIFLDSVDVYGQEDAPRGSKFQNSVVLREYHEPKHGMCKERETSLMYHTVFDEIVLGSSPLENRESRSKSSFLNPQRALKATTYIGKMKCQIIESKDFCGNEIVENQKLHHLGNPSTLRADRALQVLLQPGQDCQTSRTSAVDDSVISPCGYSHCRSLQNTPSPALDVSVTTPRITARDHEAVDEISLKAADDSTTNNSCFPSIEGTRPELVMDAASDRVTVHQTVDVCADFRACFTTSRATSARPSVVSTSSNTDITMMNQRRPGEWQGERHRSVACNTDGPHSRGHEDPPVTMSRGPLGNSLSVDSSEPNGNLLNKDSLELRKTSAITDLKKRPERESPPCEEAGRSSASRCCEDARRRAARAELHLLHLHYQMCQRHCSDIYKLVTENRAGFSRNLWSNCAKKQFGSALLSVWGDLKVRYESLKDRIHKGRPLEELPPLSVESKLLSTFSTLAFALMKEESHVFSGADSELDNQSTCDVDVPSRLKKTPPQMSLLSDDSPPKQDTLPKEDGLKNGDIDIDFSQLKLDEKGCKNYREVSEDWFDAKENLTGVDLSGIQENQIEKDKGDPKFTQEMKNTELLRKEKGYLIHVGGLCPSVSEADLRSHFRKYQVSEIAICDSTNYRYASLAFKKSIDAKMAVKEMNGIEINGKSVNVRLVKTPGEYTSSLSYKNGMERSTSKEISSASSVSRLPRTRPRQLGSEQDSEGVKKNCKQIESPKLLPDTPIRFIPPNTLNLRSFTKIMKRLAELHPEVSRDHIIDALQEVRVNHKGFLNGLSINTIVEMTSSVLKNSDSS
ncbi:RNA-binding protein 44 isoform X1 [Neofelis nebulosa]|uniref:RNA-binding protein 44 isoform X1 n=1 Tax=Neofelis nebulosa TaxID=61452 RepID=UPI00272C89E8|nr:RNA-binding protein 44 isoform X1 [Neofelis nebulosa]XP_058555755.1 RNA-binding protein 44 isoform X1 [Neofelis nebulosa]